MKGCARRLFYAVAPRPHSGGFRRTCRVAWGVPPRRLGSFPTTLPWRMLLASLLLCGQAGCLHQRDGSPSAPPTLDPQLSSSPPAGALSIEALEGELWTLVSMDGQPTPEGCSAPTVQFTGIRLASFGGCNAHMGTIQETAPGEIKVSTLAGGRKACPPAQMNLDQEFVSRLEKVSRYTFVGGRLALSGEARGAPFLLLFERTEVKAP